MTASIGPSDTATPSGSSARRRARRAALALLPVLGSLPVPALAQDCTFIVEDTRWLYHPAPPPPGWELPDHEDDPGLTGWQVGCAPFGSPGCGFDSRTPWPLGSTYHLRQHVTLTGAEFGLTARVAIDNDFELFVNGVSVGSLSKEGCATRWDSVIPIPDGLWVVGDNVVAVAITDRGGIATFAMVLDGSSPEPCPPGCARLRCDAPGPMVALDEVLACPGERRTASARLDWTVDCAGELLVRFEDGAGALVRDWGGEQALAPPAGATPFDLVALARCSQSPTCPIGAGRAAVRARAGPPPGLGDALRVDKAAGRARLDWSRAGPLLPDEHVHVVAEGGPGGPPPRRLNPEGFTPSSWIDPEAGGRRYYRVRVADACEREDAE